MRPGGLLQIDNEFINLSLVRKVQVTTANYSNGGVNMTRPTRAKVALNDNEILAFSCTAPTCIVSKDGNQVTLCSDSLAGAVITCWIFSTGGPWSSSGVQVLSASGQLCFDANWQLLKFLGQANGNGGFGYPGKTIAVIPQIMYFQTEYASVVQGVSPNVFIVDSIVVRMSAAAINNNTLQVSTAIMDQWGMQRPYPGEIGPNGSQSNNLTPSYLVIDVTGY